jgi:4,4'-diaponeurosporenoate glycosyltransferase
VLTWALFAAGWTLGWLLLWSPRRLPQRFEERPRLAIIVPARDEAEALPHLLEPLVSQLRPGDELVVVDDDSTDATAAVAASFGATVVPAPPLPAGWIGKPHACWTGANRSTAQLLVFLDADVRPAAHLLDGLAAALSHDPDVVVSVQPWHDAATPAERCSVLANIVALMGSGACTVLGRQVRTDVAYGPVLAVTRAAYERAGGHAHPHVRSSLTEDIELARRVGRSELFSSCVDATFRMYPRGAGAAVAGWSRTITAGIAATRWWLALAVAAWVWSLAGGLFAGWLAYPLSAVQVWVLGRRAGRFGPVVAVLYPAAVIALVIMIVGGLVNRVRRRTTWRGRAITPA